MRTCGLYLLVSLLVVVGCSQEDVPEQKIVDFTLRAEPVDTTGNLMDDPLLVLDALNHPHIAYEWSERYYPPGSKSRAWSAEVNRYTALRSVTHC